MRSLLVKRRFSSFCLMTISVYSRNTWNSATKLATMQKIYKLPQKSSVSGLYINSAINVSYKTAIRRFRQIVKKPLIISLFGVIRCGSFLVCKKCSRSRLVRVNVAQYPKSTKNPFIFIIYRPNVVTEINGAP